MPFQPGNSGYLKSQRRARMFVAALRMEIAAAGPDALRRVARTLIVEACKGNLAAASMIGRQRGDWADAAASHLGRSPSSDTTHNLTARWWLQRSGRRRSNRDRRSDLIWECAGLRQASPAQEAHTKGP